MGYYKQRLAGAGYQPTGEKFTKALEDFLSPLFAKLELSPTFSADNLGTILTPVIHFENFDICVLRVSVPSSNPPKYMCRLQVSQPGSNELINGNAWNFDVYENAHHGFMETSDMNITCHAAVGKSNQVISFGLSPYEDNPPYLMATIVKDRDTCFAIQHTVNPGQRDVYIRSADTYKMMSPATAKGYYSDSQINLVPAINPWESSIIPDLYITSIRPDNTFTIRNQISVNNRTFVSGVVTDIHDSGYMHAMATFVEI